MGSPSTSTEAQPAEDKVSPQKAEAPAAKPAPRGAAPQFVPEPPARAEQAPTAPPAPAAAPAPAPAPEPSANIAAPASGVAADAQGGRTDEMRAAPQLQRSMPERRSAAAQLQANVVQTPEDWLARIARMRELGQDEAADKELARFRERYPDYRLSEAMAKKVEKQAPAGPTK
jgi:hypothetical protein